MLPPLSCKTFCTVVAQSIFVLKCFFICFSAKINVWTFTALSDLCLRVNINCDIKRWWFPCVGQTHEFALRWISSSTNRPTHKWFSLDQVLFACWDSSLQKIRLSLITEWNQHWETTGNLEQGDTKAQIANCFCYVLCLLISLSPCVWPWWKARADCLGPNWLAGSCGHSKASVLWKLLCMSGLPLPESKRTKKNKIQVSPGSD